MSIQYPITEEHKRLAVDNIKRLAPGLSVSLLHSDGWGWQVLVANPNTSKQQMFDAYLVGEKFRNPMGSYADNSMIDELRQYGLVKS